MDTLLSCVGGSTAEQPALQPADGGSTPTPTHQSLLKSEWEVKTAPLLEAQSLVRKYHYAKGGSNTAVYVHGLFRRDNPGKVWGIAWWLPPTRVACESVDRARWKQVLSLTRLVCLPEAPKNAASFLLGQSIRLIRKDGRFVALVTYADESQGHVGTIYRASNWTYVGRTGPYPRWLDEKGVQRAAKATKNRTKAQMEALGFKKQGTFYKHKFVLFL